jgi:hypothetical protein
MTQAFETNIPRLLNEVEVAEIRKMSPASLRRERWAGGGPPFVKMGRRVRYDLNDLVVWLNERKRTSTSDPGLAS